jgi:membrane dipeptidase
MGSVLIMILYLLITRDDRSKDILTQTNQIYQSNASNTLITKSMDSGATDPLEIHNRAIMIDSHNDFVYQVFEKGVDITVNNPNTQSDLPKFREGGVDVQVFAVWIPTKQLRNSYGFTVSQIEKLQLMAKENPDKLQFAGSYDDIIRITGEGKLCGLIGIEGGTALKKDEALVAEYFALGVRYIGLTWNNSNLIASSARDETEKGVSGGLTEFGKTVIRKMNEVGMMIDVSHLGEKAFWDVIRISVDPIIASHSNCYSLNPHFRNLTDEQIIAIAEKGGYIGINFHDKFLVKSGKASIDDIVNHIDHIKKVAGIDHIGIGSDFDGGISPPTDLQDATKYPELTKRLLERGYTAEEVKKILGENFLRVFRNVCG